MNLTYCAIVVPQVIGPITQALQRKVPVQDQEIAVEMEELFHIEGQEDDFTLHAFEIDEPLDGSLPLDTAKPVALITSLLK
jgi:predicted nucleic acid-binding protein